MTPDRLDTLLVELKPTPRGILLAILAGHDGDPAEHELLTAPKNGRPFWQEAQTWLEWRARVSGEALEETQELAEVLAEPVVPPDAPAFPVGLTLEEVRREVGSWEDELGPPGSDLHDSVLRFRFAGGAHFVYTASEASYKLPADKRRWVPSESETWPVYAVDAFAGKIFRGEERLTADQRNLLDRRPCWLHAGPLTACSCPPMVDLLVGVLAQKAKGQPAPAPLPAVEVSQGILEVIGEDLPAFPPPGSTATSAVDPPSPSPAPPAGAEHSSVSPSEVAAVVERVAEALAPPAPTMDSRELPAPRYLFVCACKTSFTSGAAHNGPCTGCGSAIDSWAYMATDPELPGPAYAKVLALHASARVATKRPCVICCEPFLEHGEPPLSCERGGSKEEPGLVIAAHVACVVEHVPKTDTFVCKAKRELGKVTCDRCKRELENGQDYVLVGDTGKKLRFHRSVRACVGQPPEALARELAKEPGAPPPVVEGPDADPMGAAKAAGWKGPETAGRKLKSKCLVAKCGKEIEKGQSYLSRGDDRAHVLCLALGGAT